MSDLVQRLRKQANMTNLPTTWGEAADRIESLEQCLLQAQNASIDLAKQLAEAQEFAAAWHRLVMSLGCLFDFDTTGSAEEIGVAASQAYEAHKARLAEAQGKVANLMHAVNAKQAKIDELMLEFCPGEMTAEQLAEWEAHQKVAHTPAADGRPSDCSDNNVAAMKDDGAEGGV